MDKIINTYAEHFQFLSPAELEGSDNIEGFPKSNIYMILEVEKIRIDENSIKFDDSFLTFKFTCGSLNESVRLDFDKDFIVKDFSISEDGRFFDYKINDSTGSVLIRLFILCYFKNFMNESRYDAIRKGKVLYIGQSRRPEGAGPTRLIAHEHLQKIIIKYSVDKTKENKEIYILLTTFNEANDVTVLGGMSNKEFDINKLDNTDLYDEDMIRTLSEASLIYYFQPEYNKEFKASYPSEKHSRYSVAYQNNDAMGFSITTSVIGIKLYSDVIEPSYVHIEQIMLDGSKGSYIDSILGNNRNK